MSQSAPEAPPEPGPVIAGEYELLGVIGGGGMGRVYRARQRGLDREVAIKVLRTDESDPEGARAREERFTAEATLCASLTHPNVVRVFDFGAGDGVAWLVMELLEGRTLDAVMAEGPCPPAFALRVAEQLCGALAEAHRLGIVHRDIKPSNVVHCPTPELPGFVKLTDFGLAARGPEPDPDRAIDPGPASAFVEGTPHYAAPEQIRHGVVDHRADIYGLGALLLALLTGRHPFAGPSTVDDVLQRQLDGDPPALLRALAGRAPAIPVPVARLVADCMQRDVDQRIGSATELLRRIGEVDDVLAAMGRALEAPADRTVSPLPEVGELATGRTVAPALDPDPLRDRPDTVSAAALVGIGTALGLAFAVGMWLG